MHDDIQIMTCHINRRIFTNHHRGKISQVIIILRDVETRVNHRIFLEAICPISLFDASFFIFIIDT